MLKQIYIQIYKDQVDVSKYLKTVRDSHLEPITTYTVHPDAMEAIIGIDDELAEVNKAANCR